MRAYGSLRSPQRYHYLTLQRFVESSTGTGVCLLVMLTQPMDPSLIDSGRNVERFILKQVPNYSFNRQHYFVINYFNSYFFINLFQLDMEDGDAIDVFQQQTGGVANNTQVSHRQWCF